MCSCVHKGKSQNIVLNEINQKPVRLDMAFPKTFERTRQFMVTKLFLQREASAQCIDDFIQ